MSDFFKVSRQEIEWAGRLLVLETGKVARQADGAVMVTYGETSVLCTAVYAKAANPSMDFFPLTIVYQEKSFAVGRIPGGFNKREGRPSEKEVLTSRLIDRPIRPLFPDHFRNEIQVICTALSYDQESDVEVAAMIGASAALALSGAPFMGPIAAARVGYIDEAFVLNPTHEQLQSSMLDLVVAGTQEGVLMVESKAHELPESTMLGAVVFGHESFQPIITMIQNLKKDAGRPAWQAPAEHDALFQDMVVRVQEAVGEGVISAYAIQAKQDRSQAIQHLKETIAQQLKIADDAMGLYTRAFKQVESEVLRHAIFERGVRIDGRDLTTVRPIRCETGFLPRAHGSALFTRGETQALVVTTLGTTQDEQIVDALEGEYRERFMLHYNFPPYSVNEVGRMGIPGRREVGHGKLAWRALHPLLPEKEAFPYTIRTVSEVTESNGSSSMATVCGVSLALMDAGVPLARPIAGIAMGLIQEGEKFAVLTDILGDEDHLGDMDFKVAGTESGVTALQMDLKVTSITPEIMKQALVQAREGRLHILNEMSHTIQMSRGHVSEHAPKMVTVEINKDKIRDLIGPGGKKIREICESTNTRIDIDDEGSVRISGYDNASIEAAVAKVRDVACDPEIGKIYEGKVVKIMEFGAFVNFMGAKDGLVHISEISPERIKRVEDVLTVGEEVKVKVLGVDDRGKIKLSIKAVSDAGNAGGGEI